MLQYLAWAELFLASLFNPQASFLGHLAGILAGLLHVRVIAPALPALRRTWRRARLNARIRRQPGTARFASHDSRVARQAPGAAARAESAVAAAVRRPGAAATTTAAGAAEQRVLGGGRGMLESEGATAAGRHSQQHDDVAPVLHQGQAEPLRSAPLSAEELRLRRLQRFGG